MLRGLALGLALLLVASHPVQACAIASVVRVLNGSSVRVREIFVSAPSVGPNQLPTAGLAPGDAALVTLPSCIGTYDVSVVFADGRRDIQRDLDGQRIREFTLR